ncbi:MAG: hypothetical protein MK135_17055, partial [Polyangiaceae bacterium]|nr:hypothetical protein [Polyangiaceae bacterium]
MRAPQATWRSLEQSKRLQLLGTSFCLVAVSQMVSLGGASLLLTPLTSFWGDREILNRPEIYLIEILR